MLRRCFLFLLLFSVHSFAVAATVVVVGDSLSAGYGIDPSKGWVRLMAQRLQQIDPSHRVINASISGDTSDGGLTRLPELLRRFRPSVVVLALGGNDGLRGLPLRRLRSNLSQMIEQAKSAGASPLLVGMRLPPNYGPRYTNQFHEVYKKLGDQQGIALVPFLLEGVAIESGLMQEDGIHPRAEAQQRIVENVWPQLTKILGSNLGGK